MKKINHKTLTIKSIVYRLWILISQTIFVWFFTKDWIIAGSFSLFWNIINTGEYYLYEWIFAKFWSPRVQTKGSVILFTGLSGAGKTTIADIVAQKLKERGKNVERLDGDIARKQGLSDDLGFTKEDRNKNINRISFVSKLLSRNDTIVLASFISPYRETRKRVKENVSNFIEIFVDCPLDVCEAKDVKGMYAKARKGKIKNFTGISDPYQRPIAPDLRLRTDVETIPESVEKVMNYLKNEKLI